MRIILILFTLLMGFNLSAQEGELATARQIDAYVDQFIDAKVSHSYCKEDKKYGNIIHQAVDTNLVWFMDSWGTTGEDGSTCKMALKHNKLVYYNLTLTNASGIHQYILYYDKVGMLIDAAYKKTVTTFADNSISTKTNLSSISAADVEVHLKRYNDYHAMWEFKDYTSLSCGHE